MKRTKGTQGYLNHHLIMEALKILVSFALIIGIVVLGIIQTGSRLNWLTIIAILGALPACKMVVDLITRFPYRSIPEETAKEILEKTPNITAVFDMIITSEEKIMPIDCIVISGLTICGYTRSKKVDTVYAAKHIKNILSQNGYDKVTVKIFDGYTAFLTRAEGMNSIAAVDGSGSSRQEEKIKQLILNISM